MAITNAQNALLAKKNDIPFFADLSHEEVLKVTEDVEFLRLNKKDQIFDQGEMTKSIFYVVRGSVEIEIKKIDKDNKEELIPVAILQKRAFFGEMAFITGEPRTARAISAEDDTAILTFKIVNDVDSNDLSTIRTLALVYYYFAQDLAQKLKTTSANYAKIKTVDDINYDELLALLLKIKNEITNNNNVLSIENELLNEINGFFPISYDPTTQKEVVKTAISESFALNEKDLIIFAKDRIVIRLFQEQAIPIELEHTEKNIDSIMGDEEAANYIRSIYSSKAEFEKEVLGCSGDGCEQTIAKMFGDILTKMPQQKFLSFLHMPNYSCFKLSKAVEALDLYLTETIKKFYTNSCEMDERDAKDLVATEESRTFIRSIAIEYAKQFKLKLMQMIADTFVKAAALDTPPPIVDEAIKGTLELKPILAKPDGGFVAAKANQIQIRYQQALKNREKCNLDLLNEFEKIKKNLNKSKKQLSSFDIAKMVSAEKLKSYDHRQLRDIVVNENNQFDDQKMVLAYIPSGEKTLILKETSDKGVRSATNDTQKEEYQRTYKFFNSIHDNNTEKELKAKRVALEDKARRLHAQKNKTEELVENEKYRRIEEFDDGLRKIYEAILQNLGKKI